MPRSLTIDFFKTEDPSGRDLDIRSLICRAISRSVDERRVDFGEGFILLHNVRPRPSLLFGEIVKVRMTDLPDKVSRSSGVPSDLGLSSDEGVGRHAHFLYDSDTRCLLLQRDNEVRHPAFTQSISTPLGAKFGLSLVFKQNALARLDRMRIIRKFTFKVARPDAAAQLRQLNPSAAYAIDLMNEHRGRFIDIDISVGRSREDSLSRQSVLRFARGLLGRRDDEALKLIVAGKEQADSPTEVIDLLEDRLTYTAAADYRGRRLDPRECQRVLLEAHDAHARYLQTYRHPQ